jgi:hypothetical protein
VAPLAARLRRAEAGAAEHEQGDALEEPRRRSRPRDKQEQTGLRAAAGAGRLTLAASSMAARRDGSVPQGSRGGCVAGPMASIFPGILGWATAHSAHPVAGAAAASSRTRSPAPPPSPRLAGPLFSRVQNWYRVGF